MMYITSQISLELSQTDRLPVEKSQICVLPAKRPLGRIAFKAELLFSTGSRSVWEG